MLTCRTIGIALSLVFLGVISTGAVHAATPPGARTLVIDQLGKGLTPLDGFWQFYLGDNPAWAAELLGALNRRLHGRLHGGFATYLALRLDPDGACTLASAGHPAPFLNESEIALSGALPLGLIAGATYRESAIHLSAGDHLALYTDGLLEARSATGELYGFDRVRTLFAAEPDAAKATEAAVAFGQDDDITVLILTRLGIGEASSAGFSTPVFESAG
jgi:Stage II sporulation protein E (SpoIIE)